MINKIVETMYKENIVNDIDEATYAITFLFEKVISIISLLIIGALFNKLTGVVLFIIIFCMLRRYTGGFHCNSFIACYFTSILVMIAVIMINLYCVISKTLLLIVLIVSGIIILYIGAINHPNMNWTINEKRHSISKARVTICIECIITYILLLHNIDTLIPYYMVSAITLCSLLLLLAKATKQEV